MRFPALAIAFLFAAGIMVGGIFAPTLPHAFAATLAASFVLIVSGVALVRKHVTLAWIASLLTWCLLGVAAIHVERLQVPANQVTHLVAENRLELSEPLRWRGQLRSDPLRLPWGIRYDVDLDQVQSAATWIPVSGGLRADYFFDERSREAPPQIRAGDRIEVLLRARLVRNFADPGVTDHRALMADQNIYLTGSPRNTTLIQKIPGPPPTIANRLARARGRLLSETDAMLAGSPGSSAVARAMLLGDRSFLDSQQIEAFRDTGVYHVLVLAGLHVGMLVAALLWVGRKLRLPLVARTFITLAALGAYVAVVEDRTPIVRASLMAAAYLLGRLLFRRTHLLNAVGLAALLVLLVRPSELTDASFLLSFLAVGVIAAIAAPWLESSVQPYLRALDHLGDVARDAAHAPRVAQFRLDARAAANWLSAHLPKSVSRLGTSLVTVPARAGLRLWELIVISVALQVGMIPLMAQYFHRISLVGFAANLPAVLLTGIIVPLGFAALCTSLVWGALGHALGRALAAMVGALLWSVNWFAGAPHASFRVPSPPSLLIAAFFLAALGCAWAVLTAKRRVAWIACAAVLAAASLIAAYPFAPRLNRGRLEITVLDVGQGDSIFVAFPDGRTMLVDGGGLPGGNYIRGARAGIDVGEDVVSPFLWSRGLKRLDVVALTHAHEDHYGGLASVLRNFQVGELWLGHDADSQGYHALLAEAQALRVPIIHRIKGESFDWDGVHLGVLWPADDAPVKIASNDDSLVMRLQEGQETMLLTGDIENRSERALTNDGDPLSADFLKVPHHGSKTSSTQAFIDAVHPHFAVISVGEDNGFGQPNGEVIDRIQQEGARLYRTDRDGAVTALSDGHQVTVHSYLEKP
jgi:competence protein ComEC